MKGQIFDPIVLEWDGREYTIPPHKVMGAIHRIERFITFPEMQEMSERGGAPMGTLASAYASVLRYAGLKITDAEVYQGMFEEGGADTVLAAVNNMLFMMLPRSARSKMETQEAEGQSEPDEESVTGNSAGETRASSKRPSRRSSQKA